jgi:hypothetical protein
MRDASRFCAVRYCERTQWNDLTLIVQFCDVASILLALMVVNADISLSVFNSMRAGRLF